MGRAINLPKIFYFCIHVCVSTIFLSLSLLLFSIARFNHSPCVSCVRVCVHSYRYLVRPSPFSAQKTFERHNSRRKSNISYCSNLNIGQTVAAAAAAAASRRGSGFGLNALQGVLPGYGSQRAPPIVTNKSNSLSLPDSPTLAGQTRARSNSLRVNFGPISYIYFRVCMQAPIIPYFNLCFYFFFRVHKQIESDMLLRRSSSLRQGLPSVGISGRRKSSLEEIGISHFTTLMQATNHSNPIKISLNGSIGLEVGQFILYFQMRMCFVVVIYASLSVCVCFLQKKTFATFILCKKKLYLVFCAHHRFV